MRKFAAASGCILLVVGCSSAIVKTDSGSQDLTAGSTTSSDRAVIDSSPSPFVGKWCGYSWNSHPSELVVSEVTDAGVAKGTFLLDAWRNIGWKANEFEGRIVNGELEFDWVQQHRNNLRTTAKYKLREDGSIVGRWARPGFFWFVVQKRCDDSRPEMNGVDATNFRSLLGNWCGRWRNRPSNWSRKTMITFKDVTHDGFVTLIYTGDNPTTTSKLHKGIVVGRNLHFSLGKRPAEFSFEYTHLSGTIVGATGTNDIEVHRCIDQERASFTADHGQDFLGHWCGNWDNGALYGRLVVRSMNSRGDARGVYMTKYMSYGTSSDVIRGRFKQDSELDFTLKNDAKVQYWLESKGRLAGTYERPGARGQISAKPCPPDAEFGALN